jgi:hypothetical protein
VTHFYVFLNTTKSQYKKEEFMYTKLKKNESLETLIAKCSEHFSQEKPLPEWPEGTAALMNALIRSEVFSPLEKVKARERLHDAPLVSQSNYTVVYTGIPLDQGDADVFLQIISLHSGIIPGNPIQISLRPFLQSVGRAYGTRNRNWMIESLERLSSAYFKIKFSTNTYVGEYSGGILDVEFLQDIKPKKSDLKIMVTIPVQFFNRFLHDYTKLPMRKRLALKGKASQLAKWLHSYYASHREPYPVSVDFLRKLSGSKIRDLFVFRYQLKLALKLLKDNGDIANWSFDKNDRVEVARKI